MRSKRSFEPKAATGIYTYHAAEAVIALPRRRGTAQASKDIGYIQAHLEIMENCQNPE